MAKEKGVVISLITFEDSESEIYILKNMVELSGGEIIRVNPSQILEGFNDLLENNVIASDVEVKLNLNKCMTFRDEEKINMINDESTYSKKIGNAAKETETYHELKFKSSIKLAEYKDIDFDKLDNLVFQVEIKYKKTDGKKYIRVITQNLEVSDNKDMVNKQAKMNIISTLQSRKSAKLAGQGNLMDAQAQIHVARNFLFSNSNLNQNNQQIFHQFNRNMNSFHNNMNMNNQMAMSPIQNYNHGGLFGNNMNMMNNNNNLFGGMFNMNQNQGLFGNSNKNMNNNMMMNNMNNNMMMNNMNMMNNNMNMMNNNSDYLSAQIFQIANSSENQNNINFQRTLNNNS